MIEAVNCQLFNIINYMIELLEDIKIVLEREIALNFSRIYLNNGTEIIPSEIADRDNYSQGSFLPRQEWRIANLVEIDRLNISPACLPTEWNLGKYIGVTQIPDDLIQPLRDIINNTDLNPQQPGEDIHQVTLHPDYPTILEQLSIYLQQYSLIPDRIQPWGLHSHRSGLVTSTLDTVRFLPNKPQIGLHLESTPATQTFID
jgi:hypothetical protein